MIYFVYVLRSIKTNRLYTGSTSDLDVRLSQHQEGLSRSTKHGRPWKLLHHEQFPTRAEAFRREQYLKSGKGRDELARLLAGTANLS
jgi:putative endonuclease